MPHDEDLGEEAHGSILSSASPHSNDSSIEPSESGKEAASSKCEPVRICFGLAAVFVGLAAVFARGLLLQLDSTQGLSSCTGSVWSHLSRSWEPSTLRSTPTPVSLREVPWLWPEGDAESEAIEEPRLELSTPRPRPRLDPLQEPDSESLSPSAQTAGGGGPLPEASSASRGEGRGRPPGEDCRE